jgi:hypothetical protein
MTDAKILELATYHFHKGKKGWTGTDEGIVEFAKVIQDKILEQVTLKLEELK